MSEFGKPEISINKKEKFSANVMRLDHLAEELEVIESVLDSSAKAKEEKGGSAVAHNKVSAGELVGQELAKVLEARKMIFEEVDRLVDEQDELLSQGVQMPQDEQELSVRIMERIKKFYQK